MDYPFGNLAIPEGPMALRPNLADGLPLSRNPWLYTGRTFTGTIGHGDDSVKPRPAATGVAEVPHSWRAESGGSDRHYCAA